MKPGKTITTSTGQLVCLTYQKPGPKPLPPEQKKRRVNLALAHTGTKLEKDAQKHKAFPFPPMWRY